MFEQILWNSLKEIWVYHCDLGKHSLHTYDEKHKWQSKNKSISNKMKNMYSKDTLKKVKRQTTKWEKILTEWEKIFTNHVSDKRPVLRIHTKSYSSILKNKQTD